MHTHILSLVYYLLSIYLFGLIGMYIFGKILLKKGHIALVLSFVWILGNGILTICLYVLGFFNKLSLISMLSVRHICLTLCGIVLMMSFFKKKELTAFFKRISIYEVSIMLLIIIFLIPFFHYALFSYLIDWDAVAIWFIKAKTFFYAGGIQHTPFFKEYLQLEYAHKNYPIGIPLVIAGYYTGIGVVQDQFIKLYFALFYLHLILLLYGFLKMRHRWFPSLIGIVAVISVLLFPYIVIYSQNGYADVALSLIIASSVALFILFIEAKNNQKNQWLALLFFIASYGATIKNEGVAFFIVVQLMVMSILLPSLSKRPFFSVSLIRLTKLFVVLSVGYFPLFFWQYMKMKLTISEGAYLEAVQIRSLFDLSRLKLILNYYFVDIFNVSKYGTLLTPALLLYIVQCTMMCRQRKFAVFIPSLVLIAQLSVYTGLYMITSVELIWQVKTSFDRLFLHLIPAFYIVLMYQMKPFIETVTSFLSKKTNYT